LLGIAYGKFGRWSRGLDSGLRARSCCDAQVDHQGRSL